MSIESVLLSNHLILCHLLLLLPSTLPTFTVFSRESTLCIRWPEYWSFTFNISPSNEHPGLISFRLDWLDLFGVQGTLKSLFQHHSSKASIFRPSAFFIVQLLYLPWILYFVFRIHTFWSFIGGECSYFPDAALSILLSSSALVFSGTSQSIDYFVPWLQGIPEKFPVFFFFFKSI